MVRVLKRRRSGRQTPRDRGDEDSEVAEYQNADATKKRRLQLNKLNEFKKIQRTDLFNALNKLYKDFKGFEYDFEYFGKILKSTNEKRRESNAIVCKSGEEEARRNEIRRAVDHIMGDGWSTKDHVHDGELIHTCAFDAAIALVGLDDSRNYTKKTAMLDSTVSALFNQSRDEICDTMDTALLCVEHRIMRRFSLLSSYDLFNYQAEPFIGTMSKTTAVDDFVSYKHGKYAPPQKYGPKEMPAADPLPPGVWGDIKGRTARGIFVQIIEHILIEQENIQWMNVMKEFKDVLRETNGIHSGACLMELYEGELAAEMVAIAWRIFNGHEIEVILGHEDEFEKMPKLPELVDIDTKPDTFADEFGAWDDFREGYGENATKEAGRAYIRRLMYTSKKYSWFLNTALAPLIACMIERAAQTENFDKHSTLTIEEYSSAKISNLNILVGDFDVDREGGFRPTVIDYHRNMGLRIEDGQAHNASEELAKYEELGFKKPPSGEKYRKQAYKDMGMHTVWKMWGNRVYVSEMASSVNTVAGNHPIVTGVIVTIVVVAGSCYAVWHLLPTFGTAATTVAERLLPKPLYDVGYGAVQVVSNAPGWMKTIFDAIQLPLTTAWNIIRGGRPAFFSGGMWLWEGAKEGLRQTGGAIMAIYNATTGTTTPVNARITHAMVTNTTNTRIYLPNPRAIGKHAGTSIGAPASTPTDEDGVLTDHVFGTLLKTLSTPLSPIEEQSELSDIGGMAANSVGLKAMGYALSENITHGKVNDEELERTAQNFLYNSREIMTLLNDNPDRVELEQTLLKILPQNMKNFTFVDIPEPPRTRQKTANERNQRQRTEITRASLACTLDIVAPLSGLASGLHI